MFGETPINNEEKQFDVKTFFIPFKGDVVINEDEISVTSSEVEGKRKIFKWEEGIADEYREFLNDRKGNIHLGLEVAERFVTNVTVGVISNAIGSG